MPLMLQPPARQPGFVERLGAGLGEGISKGAERGLDFAQQLGVQQLKNKQDKTLNLRVGLDTIDEMRQIADKGNIGRGSALFGFFGGETSEDRGKYQALGNSLIPLAAAGVSIRNQKEFEQYSKTLANPSAPLSEIKGALDGLERIIKSQLPEGKKDSSESKASKSGKIRFNPSHPEHKAKRDQLMKAFKGDREKVGEALAREFEL